MRLRLEVDGLVLLEVRLFERDDDEDDDPLVPGAVSSTEIATGDPPFGFRPTPDPWPPSWE